jgi:hypothetical protein
LGFGLSETPDVPNTIMVGNPLIFPTVHNTAPIGWQFTCYDSQKLNRSAETGIWADYTLQHNSGI